MVGYIGCALSRALAERPCLHFSACTCPRRSHRPATPTVHPPHRQARVGATISPLLTRPPPSACISVDLVWLACSSGRGVRFIPWAQPRGTPHTGVPRRQLTAGRREVRTSPRHRHGLHARGRPPLCSHDRLPTDPPLLQVCPRLPALRMPAGTPPPLAPGCALLSAPVRRQEHPHSLCSRRARAADCASWASSWAPPRRLHSGCCHYTSLYTRKHVYW